ncbi:6365_t:CDS:2, partial [Gigaspora rosea]
TINPATGQAITSVIEANEKDVDIAVEAATKAFNEKWINVDGQERGRLINKLADLIERDLDELAALEALDNGKAYTIAKSGDLPLTVAVFRYFAGWCDKIHGKVIETQGDKFCYTRHEPIGVCGAIIPWNYPLLMLAWKLAPALACGNTIVLKTSELTPLSALKVAALFKEAGFPKGVSLSQDRQLPAADSNLKKVSLELGGKSPNIILADSDLEEAVKWAYQGIYQNHGQSCAAGSRVYVEEPIYDNFIEKFKTYAQNIKVGDPFHKDTYQGPQISQRQFDRIMKYIECGKKEGATLLLGGKRHGDQGYYVSPTIFTDVNENMTIMQEEIFGPVVAIAKFKTIDEVIEKAHMTKYGLAAAVFTKDITRAIKISNTLRAGTVWGNPFGGFKESGFGRELGKYALELYTQVKTVQINLEC